MADEDEATVTIVTDDTPTDTPTVDTGDTTVIVAPEEDTEQAVSVEHRLTLLEQRLEEIANRSYQAEATAEVALDVAEDAAETANDAGEYADVAADDAVETAVEAVDGAEVVETEDASGDDVDVVEVDDTPGRRTHWLDRSFSEWRFKK